MSKDTKWLLGILLPVIMGLFYFSANAIIDAQNTDSQLIRSEVLLIRSDIKDIEKVVIKAPEQISDIEEDIDDLEEDLKEHKKEGHR